MSKRGFAEAFVGEGNTKSFLDKRRQPVKKHTLDSDEEESEDENILDADDIEGEEDGINRQEGEQKMTAFNMKEEMEEGHFDKDGHFIWKNEKEIRDNWLDNIDWQKIEHSQEVGEKYNISEAKLGEESDSDEAEMTTDNFNELATYKSMLELMRPKESVKKSLKRLAGDNMKLSSVERLKRKKAGTLKDNGEVIKLTELSNKILTKQGNMNIYEETYEQITHKVMYMEKKIKLSTKEPELDMYADNFEEQEKTKIASSITNINDDSSNTQNEVLMWEFKWKVTDEDIHGPYTTAQMIKWSKENYFKDGVMVRKCGDNDSRFYNSNRIDFELYE